MKKIAVLCFLLFFSISALAQLTYTLGNETLELKQISEGTLDLYVNNSNGQKRFFVKKDDGDFQELLENLEPNSNTPQFIYVLKSLTKDTDVSTERVRFSQASIKNFVGFYNYKKDLETDDGTRDYPVNFRFGVSGGITNSPFVENPDNTLSPLVGMELEIYGDAERPRHAGFLQGRYSFSSDEFDYSATEFSLGYRFRIINRPSFNVYVQNKFATLKFERSARPELQGEEIVIRDINETNFNMPLIFGIGTDIKVCDTAFITVIVGELFALLQENNGNFPTDISVGYKFNL